MRWMLPVLVVASCSSCSSCSSGGGGGRSHADGRALQACLGAMGELSAALDEPGDALMRTPIARRPWAGHLACAELYRAPPCAEAWRAAFRAVIADDTADSGGQVAPLLEACAHAYCPRLSPAPAACSPGRVPEGVALVRLVELDRAILAHEGVPAAAIATIGGRARLFAGISVEVERAARPLTEPSTLTLMVDGAGALRSDEGPTDLAALAPRLRVLAADHGHVLLVAPSDLSGERLTAILAGLRSSGVTDIQLELAAP